VVLVSLDLDFLLSAKFVAFLWLRSSGRYFISIFFRCSAPPGSRFSWFAGASGACEPGVSFFFGSCPSQVLATGVRSLHPVFGRWAEFLVAHRCPDPVLFFDSVPSLG
jgi:hypothetical protein